MTKLNLKLWNINKKNSWLIPWTIEDLKSWINNSVQATVNTVSPSVNTILNNSLQLLSSPIKTTFNKWNWGKLFKSLWVIPADILTKAISLPFRSLDKALDYVLNNNLERWIETVKWVTTNAVANIISNNWKAWKFRNAIWTWIEWFGDLIGSTIKLAPWALSKWIKGINNNVTYKMVWKTEWWVNGLNISDKKFIDIEAPFINDNYSSWAADDYNESEWEGEDKKAA